VKIFVDWVLSRPYRLVLVAIVFTLLLPAVTAALMVLNTLHRGSAQGAAAAAVAVAVVAVLAVASGAEQVLWVGGSAMGFGVAIGALLRWAGGLALGFQGTVLGAYAAVIAVSLFGPEPAVMIEPLQQWLIEFLQAGEATPEQLDLIRTSDTMLLGLAFAVIFTQLVGAMLLGYWWMSLASGQRRFGPEFRALKLGRMLGISAMVLVSLGLVVDVPVVQNLSVIALFGFLFQGLAVMHAWAHARKWHAAFIWPVYVLLITPLTWIAVFSLSAVGLLDNVFELRAGARAGT
jgi:hypothetical protein